MSGNLESLNHNLRRSAGPILACTKAFLASDSQPCVRQNFQNQDWYHGTGIKPADHPGRLELAVLDRHLPDACCAWCASRDVLVVALQGCVSEHSGDAYYDYELHCRRCGQFTACSYAEN